MASVIEELSGDSGELDAAHVKRRVEDWRLRVSGLYDQVQAWLPSRLSTDTSQTVRMYEDVMKKFGVPAMELPVLNIYDRDDWVAKLVPRGLWIIGANGRLDLFTRDNQAIVVDKAENFESPSWQIAPANKRRNSKPLTSDMWIKAIGL
ncbi:MAG TPA: hypothetical protein VK446_07110 [Methylocystis sp.]|nr:hypothetical protein [Methylocystis sp.]